MYKFTSFAKSDQTTAWSDTIIQNVGNIPPEVVTDKIGRKVYDWWVFPVECEVDISGAVKDTEDSELKYSIDSASFLEESYTLENGILKMNDFDMQKGSFTIRAEDSMGAYQNFEVYVEKVDVPFYILISLGIVIVLILVVVDIYLYRIFLIYFKGSFSMEVQYENGGTASSTKIPVRGRWKLNRIGLRAPKNIQFKKIYIQATGKPFVKLHIGGKGLFYNNRRISG